MPPSVSIRPRTPCLAELGQGALGLSVWVGLAVSHPQSTGDRYSVITCRTLAVPVLPGTPGAPGVLGFFPQYFIELVYVK